MWQKLQDIAVNEPSLLNLKAEKVHNRHLKLPVLRVKRCLHLLKLQPNNCINNTKPRDKKAKREGYYRRHKAKQRHLEAFGFSTHHWHSSFPAEENRSCSTEICYWLSGFGTRRSAGDTTQETGLGAAFTWAQRRLFHPQRKVPECKFYILTR